MWPWAAEASTARRPCSKPGNTGLLQKRLNIENLPLRSHVLMCIPLEMRVQQKREFSLVLHVYPHVLLRIGAYALRAKITVTKGAMYMRPGHTAASGLVHVARPCSRPGLYRRGLNSIGAD